MNRILVIDDDPAVRSSFELALESLPYDIDMASNGLDGIDLVCDNCYDLIFLDLKMAGMNGITTLRKIREHDARVPVRIITAFAPEFMEKLKEASEAGLDFGLVRKPLSRTQIQELTTTFLESAASCKGLPSAQPGVQVSSEIPAREGAADAAERAEAPGATPHVPRAACLYDLVLYVTGGTRESKQALGAIRDLCASELKGRFRLQVVDVLQEPRLAVGDEIIAVPTLIRKLPLPVRHIISELWSKQKILIGLNVKPNFLADETEPVPVGGGRTHSQGSAGAPQD